MTSTVLQAAPSTRFYNQLLERVRDSLVQDAAPGERLPSERELAQQFGVSTVTISRVLRELQAAGVVYRVPGKGTFRGEAAFGAVGEENNHAFAEPVRTPPVLASGVISRQTPKMDVLIMASLTPRNDGTPSHELWSHRVATSIERYLQRQGLNTRIINESRCAEGEVTAAVAEAAAEGTRGFVVLDDMSAETRHTLERRLWSLATERGSNPYHTIEISWDQFGNLPGDVVRFDGEMGSFLATRHLLELGHRNICFLAPSLHSCMQPSAWMWPRLRGFYRALELADITPMPAVLRQPLEEHTDLTPLDRVIFADGVTEIEGMWGNFALNTWKKLRARGPVSGIVVTNDQMACKIMAAAQEEGIVIPRDLSMVGFDDRHESVDWNLTTVHVPLEELGEAAAQLLFRRFQEAENTLRTELVLQPSLVVRRSTRAV